MPKRSSVMRFGMWSTTCCFTAAGISKARTTVSHSSKQVYDPRAEVVAATDGGEAMQSRAVTAAKKRKFTPLIRRDYFGFELLHGLRQEELPRVP